MNLIRLCSALPLFASLVAAPAPSGGVKPPTPPKPANLIFDPDIGNDCDDAMALPVPGRVEVLPDSFTKFMSAKDGRDRCLIVDCERSARIRGRSAALVTEAPAVR